MNREVIAVDFDGTLFTNKWPEIGEPIWNVINWCKVKKLDKGAILILWTCRSGDRLEEAIRACRDVDLIFDYINENCPQFSELYGNDSRKICADIYVDDKAVNSLDLTQLKVVCPYPTRNCVDEKFICEYIERGEDENTLKCTFYETINDEEE